jgi:hypothetical protein
MPACVVSGNRVGAQRSGRPDWLAAFRQSPGGFAIASECDPEDFDTLEAADFTTVENRSII